MNTEHSRHSSARHPLPTIDWLDEFGKEAAAPPAPSPGRGRAGTQSRTLFDIVEAEITPLRELEPDARRAASRRMAGVAIAAILCSGVLAGAGQLASAAGRRARVPAPIPSSAPATGLAALALSAPPGLVAPDAPAVHNVPVVYETASREPAQQAVVPPDAGVDISRFRQALGALTSRDPGLEHCDLRITSADRAVALCRAGSGERTTWALDLSRSETDWLPAPAPVE